MAEVEVFGHGHFGDELEFLMDDGNAGVQGFRSRIKNSFAPLQHHASSIGQMDTAQDLQQRGLPRSVLADQGADFTAANRKRDIL